MTLLILVRGERVQASPALALPFIFDNAVILNEVKNLKSIEYRSKQQELSRSMNF